MFGISPVEYEAERELFNFWRWIDSEARRIWAEVRCDAILVRTARA
jgi:hypothetical protein